MKVTQKFTNWEWLFSSQPYKFIEIQKPKYLFEHKFQISRSESTFRALQWKISLSRVSFPIHTIENTLEHRNRPHTCYLWSSGCNEQVKIESSWGASCKFKKALQGTVQDWDVARRNGVSPMRGHWFSLQANQCKFWSATTPIEEEPLYKYMPIKYPDPEEKHPARLEVHCPLIYGFLKSMKKFRV